MPGALDITSARNVDFRGGGLIPFTQYLRPHGLRAAQWIDVGTDGIDDEVVAKARLIVEAGFFLEMEELDTWPRTASFTIGDDYGDYRFETCANGPEVPGAVRRLIMLVEVEELRATRDAVLAEEAA